MTVYRASVTCRYGCGKVFTSESEFDMGHARAGAAGQRTSHGPVCPKNKQAQEAKRKAEGGK